MERRPDESVSEDIVQHQPTSQVTQDHITSKQPSYLLVAWILLLLLGAFFLFASISDLIADARTGLPSDHMEAFHTITGVTWTNAKLSSPKITQYVTLLEVTYAVHELVFGLLFLIIVAIPFRQRSRWAWWAFWIPMLANLTYTFTIAHYSTATLVYSLIADVPYQCYYYCICQLFSASHHTTQQVRHEREKVIRACRQRLSNAV